MLLPVGTSSQKLKYFMKSNCNFAYARPKTLRALFWYIALLMAIKKHDNNKFLELLVPTAKAAYKF